MTAGHNNRGVATTYTYHRDSYHCTSTLYAGRNRLSLIAGPGEVEYLIKSDGDGLSSTRDRADGDALSSTRADLTCLVASAEVVAVSDCYSPH